MFLFRSTNLGSSVIKTGELRALFYPTFTRVDIITLWLPTLNVMVYYVTKSGLNSLSDFLQQSTLFFNDSHCLMFQCTYACDLGCRSRNLWSLHDIQFYWWILSQESSHLQQKIQATTPRHELKKLVEAIGM